MSSVIQDSACGAKIADRFGEEILKGDYVYYNSSDDVARVSFIEYSQYPPRLYLQEWNSPAEFRLTDQSIIKKLTDKETFMYILTVEHSE